MRTLFEKGDPAKYIDLPLSNYSTWPNDKLLLDGELVGVSTFSGYSYNERSMLSLGVVDSDVEIGTEVTLVWGEENGGSAKPVVERHRQVEIRAIVSPVPVLGGRAHRVRGGLLADEGRPSSPTRTTSSASDELVRRGEIRRVVASSSTTLSHGCSPIIRRWSAGVIDAVVQREHVRARDRREHLVVDVDRRRERRHRLPPARDRPGRLLGRAALVDRARGRLVAQRRHRRVARDDDVRLDQVARALGQVRECRGGSGRSRA